MPSPQGELVTVTLLDGTEMSAIIEPTIYSRRSIDALCTYYRSAYRKAVWDDMKVLSDETSMEFKMDMKQEYLGLLKKSVMPGFSEATEALQTPGGLVIALATNSSLSQQDAAKMVNEASSLLDVIKAVMGVGAGEMEAAKN